MLVIPHGIKFINDRLSLLESPVREAILNRLNWNFMLKEKNISGLIFKVKKEGHDPHIFAAINEQNETVGWSASHPEWKCIMAFVDPLWRRKGIGVSLIKLSYSFSGLPDPAEVDRDTDFFCPACTKNGGAAVYHQLPVCEKVAQ